MHRHQDLLTATATGAATSAARMRGVPMRPGEASADESLRAIARDYNAELLSLAMLGRRRGPPD